MDDNLPCEINTKVTHCLLRSRICCHLCAMRCGCRCCGRRWVAGPAPEVGISGVSVVTSPTAHWVRRLVWFVTLATSLYWLIVQIRLSVLRLENSSVVTTSRTATRLQLPFPAVTVCAGERFNIDRVMKMTRNGTTYEHWRSTDEITRYQFLRWHDVDFNEFFERASHHWNELVKACYYQGQRCGEVGTVSRSVTSQLGTCYTLVLNTSATGTWTRAQLTLDFLLPSYGSFADDTSDDGADGRADGGGGWQVFLHPDTLVLNDARLLVKNSLFRVRLSPGTLTFVRVQRRVHQHMSTSDEPCDDGITAAQNSRCVMECILNDDRLAEAPGLLNQTSTTTATTATGSDDELPCQLPWEETPEDANASTPLPCRSYAALRKALRSSPDLGTFTESEILAAYFTCTCPYHCTEVMYTAEVPENTALAGSTDGSARLALWLNMQEEVRSDQWSFTFSQLVAECGGNMGIFLGASLLSGLELLDWLLFRLVERATAAPAAATAAPGDSKVQPADDSGDIKRNKHDDPVYRAVTSVNIQLDGRGRTDAVSATSPARRGW